MRETNIENLDLNLLITLNALLEEKNVTRAALRINLSQPATSRALARLRDMFQDPLLVKGTKGMILTARAHDIYQPLQHLLADIKAIVSPPSIDPFTMQGEIIIGSRDYELATILPKTISQITTEAPNLKIRVVPLVSEDLSALQNQSVDFILTATDTKAATLHRSTLFKETYVGLAAKNNSAIKKSMTLEHYAKQKHCMVTTSGFGLSIIDTLLEQKHLKRNIVVRVPHFLAAAHIVANSDLIVTLPRRLGEIYSQYEHIVLFKPPLKIPSFPIYLYWHTRNHHNHLHRWIRRVIQVNGEKTI